MKHAINILNSEPENYSEDAKKILRSFANLHEEPVDRDQLLKLLPSFEILIVRLGIKIDKDIIDAGHRLQYIVTATTGLDHIDVTYAETKNIKVLSLKGEKEFLKEIRATAELTVGLALALIRNIPAAVESVQTGIWDRDLFKGSELYKKTIGIIGIGRLGKIVAGYCKSFGMKVIGYDPFEIIDSAIATQTASLSELLSSADIISIHVAYDNTTHNLLNYDEFDKIKPGAFLINTSRGGIINEDALLHALETKRIAGAALDVLQGEPAIHEDNKLILYSRQHNNLIITPHIGGNTCESFVKTEVFMANQLRENLIKDGVMDENTGNHSC
ncbi:MAG: hypothetical protein C4522_07360 [Desulfobacteraceae bacterium]|nr:MAG: hypothetical protein C4522_07360 [Desulfobacteraceae bacterium]